MHSSDKLTLRVVLPAVVMAALASGWPWGGPGAAGRKGMALKEVRNVAGSLVLATAYLLGLPF